MLPLDANILREVAPGQSGARARSQAKIIDEVGKVLAATLDDPRYAINTALRIAHFLAQTCHESDGFCTTEEYASGAAYEGRRDLGNTQSGDGRLFKGRGLIQLTGRANYTATDARLGFNGTLMADPTLAAVPATSLVIACDYWTTRQINQFCDRDDIITVTRRVNGGLNGIDSRRAYLAKAKQAIARLGAGQLATPQPNEPAALHRGLEGDAVTGLQQALSNKGILVSIDGVFGPGTETAVKNFQAREGLTADGIVGPATWAKLA